jgi:hypothetical protein
MLTGRRMAVRTRKFAGERRRTARCDFRAFDSLQTGDSWFPPSEHKSRARFVHLDEGPSCGNIRVIPSLPNESTVHLISEY